MSDKKTPEAAAAPVKKGGTIDPMARNDGTQLTASEMLLLEDAQDSRNLMYAIIPAVIFHALLLVMNFPNLFPEPKAEAEKPKVYVVQPVRFKPPPPKQEQQLPKPKAKKVPIPDPTPDEPEPIRIEEPEEFEIPDVDDLVLGIPEAPPPVNTGPIHVTGDVQKPEKLSAPQPQYTEIARKARIQGVVILQAIIDEQGNVTNVKVLKGLPMGLSEEAERAVSQWQFKPATLNGRPVAVYFNLTVNFQLQ